MSRESREKAKQARQAEKATRKRKVEQTRQRLHEGRQNAPHQNNPDDEEGTQIHLHGR